MSHYVYIIQSELDESYYIGSTQDLNERLIRHNQGRSMYTKTKRPWKLVYSEKFPDRSSAVKRENYIKNRKSRAFIEGLVRSSRRTPAGRSLFQRDRSLHKKTAVRIRDFTLSGLQSGKR